MPRTTRRQFAALTAGAAAALAQTTDETLFLNNGRVHTMNATNTVANTATSRNGRILAVGGRAPSGARTINLGGRTVVPGLIEPHVHIVSLANRPG